MLHSVQNDRQEWVEIAWTEETGEVVCDLKALRIAIKNYVRIFIISLDIYCLSHWPGFLSFILDPIWNCSTLWVAASASFQKLLVKAWFFSDETVCESRNELWLTGYGKACYVTLQVISLGNCLCAPWTLSSETVSIINFYVTEEWFGLQAYFSENHSSELQNHPTVSVMRPT